LNGRNNDLLSDKRTVNFSSYIIISAISDKK